MFERKARKIFRFKDGQKWRSLDPLEADIAIQAVDLDWEAKFTLLRAGDLAEALPLVEAACKVFKLTPFVLNEEDGSDNGGWSPADTMDLLGDFLKWRAETRDFTEPPQTTPKSTEEPPKTIESGTDDSSISSDNSNAEPSPS